MLFKKKIPRLPYPKKSSFNLSADIFGQGQNCSCRVLYAFMRQCRFNTAAAVVRHPRPPAATRLPPFVQSVGTEQQIDPSCGVDYRRHALFWNFDSS